MTKLTINIIEKTPERFTEVDSNTVDRVLAVANKRAPDANFSRYSATLAVLLAQSYTSNQERAIIEFALDALGGMYLGTDFDNQ